MVVDWRLAAAIVACALLAGTTIFLQRGMKGASPLRRLSYALFPLSQLVTVMVLFAWVITLGLPDWMLLLALGVTVACCPIDIILFKRLQLAQDREFAEARVRMLADQLEVQTRYNAQLEEDAAKIEQVRTDAKQQFKRAVQLLAQDEPRDLPDLFKGVHCALGEEAIRYCANPVVDVIADIKRADCVSAGVDAVFALEVPHQLPSISNVELCAVFSNLLDNALEAAKRSEGESAGTPPFVEMTATVQGNTLAVSTANSMPREQGRSQDEKGMTKSKQTGGRRLFRSIEDHGWGLSIVEEISVRHGGALVTSAENGIFHASALLVFDDSTAA